MSAGAALLFLANPMIGAAVGAGSLLAQKVLKDPIEQMFSYEYTVTGSWSDPVVTRGAAATADRRRAHGCGAADAARTARDRRRPRKPFRVAAVQTVSGGDVAANLAQVEPLIAEAAAAGARLVVLPEYFGIFGAHATDKLAVREVDGEGPQQAFLARLRASHRHLARRRHGAARVRRSGARAKRLSRVRTRRDARGTLRQDPSFRVRPRRRAL